MQIGKWEIHLETLKSKMPLFHLGRLGQDRVSQPESERSGRVSTATSGEDMRQD